MVIFVRNCLCSSLWRCGPEGLDRAGGEVGPALFLTSTRWGEGSPLENCHGPAEGKAWGGDSDVREADPRCQKGRMCRKDLKCGREEEKAKDRRVPQSCLRQNLCLEKPLHGLCSEIFFLGNNTYFSNTHTNKKPHMKHIKMLACGGTW